MKINRLKFLCIVLIFTLLMPLTPIPLKVHALGFEQSVIAGEILSTKYSSSSNGTLYYILTREDTARQEDSLIKNPNNASDVIYADSLSLVANVPQTLTLNLADLDVTTGVAYKIQAIFDNGSTDAYYEVKFMNGGITNAFETVDRYADGGTFKMTSTISGTLYAKAIASGDTVTAAQLLDTHPTEKSSVKTGIFMNTPQTISLRSPSMLRGETYKLCALLVDQYGMVHSDISTVLYTDLGNKLLSTYYDNGTLANLQDDKFVLVFAAPVTNGGQFSDYKIEFDSQSDSFQSADFFFEDDVNHFTTSIDGNKVYLTLNPYSPTLGYDAIDETAEFDNGSYRVTVTNDNGQIRPRLDENTPIVQAEAKLSQALIHQADSKSVKLSSVEYHNNDTLDTKEDDYLLVEFDGNIDLSAVANPFILSADQWAIDGFTQVDQSFVSGTDFTVTEISPNSTTKKIEFTATGAAYLNNLGTASFKVELSNDILAVSELDPGAQSVFTQYLNDYSALSTLSFNNKAIENVSAQTMNYNQTISYKQYQEGIFTPLIKATAASADTAITINSGQGYPNMCEVTLKAPSGDLKIYMLTLNADPLSLSDLKINNVRVAGFDALKTAYSITLADGTTAVPDILLSFENEDVTNVSYSHTSTGSLPGTLTYHLEASTYAGTKNMIFTFTSAVVQHNNPPTVNYGPTLPEPAVQTPPTPPASPQTVQTENAGANLIQSASQTLGQASSTGADPTTPVVKALETLTDITKETKNETALVGVLTQLSESLELVSKDLASPAVDPKAILEKVTDLTKVVESQLGKISNPDTGLKLIETYLKALQGVKDSGKAELPGLDRSVDDMLQQMGDRLGTVTLKPAPTDETLAIKAEDLTEAIAKQAAMVKQLQTLSDDFYNGSQVREIKSQLTLNMEIPESSNQFALNFSPQTLDLIKKNDLDRLGLNINGNSIILPSENFTAQSSLQVSLNFDQNQSGRGKNYGNELLPVDQKIVDFTVSDGNKPLNFFQKPVRLMFELETFNFENEDPNSLVILRFDEGQNQWIPVGGIVDPELKVIYTERSTLSQYTVMKSKKTLSQADQSWAKAEINALLNKGIIADSSSFAPASLVTRAEFAQWIAKAYGLKDSGKSINFKDVPKSNENYGAIQAVCQQGIMSGKNKNQFDPNGNLTTEEMAVMIGKVLVLFDDKKTSEKVKSKYLAELKTNQVASWAAGDTALLMELGLSKSASLADGKALVTKEVAAAVLMGAYQS